ncbi:MAG: DUF465 domain-containing protein [Reyranellaceae bacterium]
MALDAHLTELERRHHALDAQIADLQAHNSSDDLKIAELKRQKLHLKEEIEQLRHKAAAGAPAGA